MKWLLLTLALASSGCKSAMCICKADASDLAPNQGVWENRPDLDLRQCQNYTTCGILVK